MPAKGEIANPGGYCLRDIGQSRGHRHQDDTGHQGHSGPPREHTRTDDRQFESQARDHHHNTGR